MSGASEVPAIPEDVRKIAMDAEVDIRNEVDHPTDIIARAIMAALAARPVDTGREKALEDGAKAAEAVAAEWREALAEWANPKNDLQAEFVRRAARHKAEACDQVADRIRALANPENGRG